MMTLGRSHTASDTSGTEGWLRSAFAADATSATKPTRDGLDSGGNGRPIFYLDPIAAMLRWHAVAFLFSREPPLQRRVHPGAPYHTSAPEIEAQRVAPVRTLRYRPLPVDVIPPATSASRSRHAPAPAPPAPPRPLPREQLQDVAVRVEPRVLGEELLSRNAGYTLYEGTDRATSRDALHTVNE